MNPAVKVNVCARCEWWGMEGEGGKSCDRRLIFNYLGITIMEFKICNVFKEFFSVPFGSHFFLRGQFASTSTKITQITA